MHGIEYHIAHQLQKIGILLHHNRPVATLKNMTDPAVGAVKRLRVNPIELTHTSRKIPFNRFHHYMIVIGHLAPSMACPIEPFTNATENFQP